MKKLSKKKQQPARPARSEQPFFDLLRRGTEALHQGDIAKATRFLEQAHQLDRDNHNAALNLGGAYILSKKFAQAVASLEPLSERDPHNPMVWTNLGAAYLGNPILAKDDEQLRAIAAFERAIELDPVAPNVAYNLGLIHLDRHDNERALHWFQRALQANPNDRDARRFIEQLSTEDNLTHS
ncbi:MAG: tetratricopeptide repeat protein [Chloroflexi bacterium]|nr:tetratricopeptide repeat protein [Chloroflexota bacterium]